MANHSGGYKRQIAAEKPAQRRRIKGPICKIVGLTNWCIVCIMVFSE